MSSIVRFQLYDDSSRSIARQIHPDVPVAGPPAYRYGQPIQVGNDATDPAIWPHYVVANIPQLKREADPSRPDKNRIVYEVYLTKLADWSQFSEPEEFEQIRKGTPL